MKLICNVSVGNRLLPLLSINSNRRHVRSTLALCKIPRSQEFCILLFTPQNKNGARYDIKGNITQVLTKFVNEGKVTIQFKQPPHDLYIQADTIQLKGFLHILKRAIENKITDKELTYSSMSITASSTKNIAPKKLVIQKRSDYPGKGFPRTLEVLHINDIQRCSLDRGILQLTKLRVLDLSRNCIECLPVELSNLQSLSELNISWNDFGKGKPHQWNWLGGNLSKTLRLLNLSNNKLKYLPDQLIKLHMLISLHVDNNELKCLPSGIGGLRNLRVFTAANNLISSLPGSTKRLRLQNIDLANNSFDPNQQSNPAAIFPKHLPICTLKEYAARSVLLSRLPYSPDSLPLTLIDYLDHANYCVCGKACFNIYIKSAHMLLLSSVAESITVSLDGLAYVPIDCYFCSLRCFGAANYNRGRVPVIR